MNLLANPNRSFLSLIAMMPFIGFSFAGVPISEPTTEVSLEEVVQEAFQQTHDGWSCDEVVLQDALNQGFIKACQKKLPDAKLADLNWALINYRKAGKLPAKTTKRRSDKHDEYRHVAEIVARHLHDKLNITTDRIMCDPTYRSQFDRMAKELAPSVEPYYLRKAAFGLRKARKLKPELVVRIVDWGRKIEVLTIIDIVADPKIVPTRPGVYLFRDSSGYLYIGESDNLRARLIEHAADSDRKSLGSYLKSKSNDAISVEIHSFDPDSNARQVRMRRAYESELIASRKPRFNVRP